MEDQFCYPHFLSHYEVQISLIIFFIFGQASDGWYWKWLSKWRRKGEEIGITEQGELSHMEIQVSPSKENFKSSHYHPFINEILYEIELLIVFKMRQRKKTNARLQELLSFLGVVKFCNVLQLDKCVNKKLLTLQIFQN